MKNIILALGLMLTANIAWANCDMIDRISGLEKETLQQMKVECEQKKLDRVTVNKVSDAVGDKLSDPVVLTEWGRVAQEFSIALGLAAKELGVAANEFLDTPAGILTAALIIWHVAGESIIGILIAVPMLITLWWICLRAIRGLYKAKVTYTTVKKWYGTKQVKETESYPEFTESMGWIFALSIVGLGVGTLIIVANMIY